MSFRRSVAREGPIWLGVIDAVCLLLAVVVGFSVRRFLGPHIGFSALDATFVEYVWGHPGGWLVFCVSIVSTNYVVGNYNLQSSVYRFNLFVNWLFALAVSLLVVSATSFAWFELILGRGVLLFVVFFYTVFSVFMKAVVYEVIPLSRRFACRTVLLGIGERAHDIKQMVESRYVIPRHIVHSFIDVSLQDSESCDGRKVIDGVPIVRTPLDGLEKTVRGLEPDLIIMCSGTWNEMMHCFPVLRRLRFSGIEILDVLSAIELYSGRVPLDLVDEVWMMQATLAPSMAVVGRLKRLFDLVCAGILIVIAIPAGVLVWLLVKLSAPCSPAFYAQERVGQFGRIFTMHKFRTMVDGAEEPGKPVWAQKNDPRVTRLGGFLRRTRLDEIPQIWNVLRGDMSICGPRPERPELVAELQKSIPDFRERENVPPGITGWAQVQHHYSDTIAEAARKLEYDFYYIKHLSLRLDMQIVLKTIRIVLFGKERDT